MQAMHNSLKAFLLAKGYISQEVADTPGFPGAVELAYYSYATHVCGERHPPQIPANLEQVPPKILDDEEWVYLAEPEEGDLTNSEVDDDEDDIVVAGAGSDEEEEPEDEEPEEEATDEEPAQGNPEAGVPSNPEGNNVVQEPTQETGDAVQGEGAPVNGAESGAEGSTSQEGADGIPGNADTPTPPADDEDKE